MSTSNKGIINIIGDWDQQRSNMADAHLCSIGTKCFFNSSTAQTLYLNTIFIKVAEFFCNIWSRCTVTAIIPVLNSLIVHRLFFHSRKIIIFCSLSRSFCCFYFIGFGFRSFGLGGLCSRGFFGGVLLACRSRYHHQRGQNDTECFF